MIKAIHHGSNQRIEAMRPRLHQGHARRAFSLVEMMVVVAIILGMLALTVAVATTLRRGSEIRETETILSLLDQAAAEWSTQAERQPTWGATPSGPLEFKPDLFADTSGPEQVTQFLTQISKTPAVREILGRIDTDYLTTITDTTGASSVQKFRLVDPWGNRMIVLHPGPKGAGDEDGTIRTTLNECGSLSDEFAIYEHKFGVCVGARICFISAGPDGKFGNLRLHEDIDGLNPDEMAELQQAEDNLYSYPLLRPRPAP